jgi:Domain of unknown function (DUF4190)
MQTVERRQPERPDEWVTFSHRGSRYLLGYGPEYFGLWNRNSPWPVDRFPRTDEGWALAWHEFTTREPKNHAISDDGRRARMLAWGSVVAGSLGVTFLPLVGPGIALSLGYAARRRFRNAMHGETAPGKGVAKTGIVLGWVGIGLYVLMVAVSIALMA